MQSGLAHKAESQQKLDVQSSYTNSAQVKDQAIALDAESNKYSEKTEQAAVDAHVDKDKINALIKKAQKSEELTLELTEMKQLVSKYQGHEYSKTSPQPLDLNKKKLPKTSDKSINGYHII